MNDKKDVETGFEAGASVRIAPSGTRGVIVEGPDRKNRYVVAVGSMSLRTDADSISLDRSKKHRKKQHKETQTSSSASRTLRLDLHGLRRQEALDRIEKALDQALLTGVDQLEVIHGIGTGTLKAAAIDYLKSSKHVRSIRPDPGNPGTVWAYL